VLTKHVTKSWFTQIAIHVVRVRARLPVDKMPSIYQRLADGILGVGHKPFAEYMHFVPANNWYGHSALSREHELSDLLASGVPEDSYILEIGSFIGNSAIEWARAAQNHGRNTTIVCVDTWLGDVGMWHDKGKWLGPRGIDGEPRLFEQFLANVHASGFSHRILPVRMSSVVGLKYFAHLTSTGRITRPHVIYLDSAHEYPETELEIRAAWDLLPAGGFLVGDDYDDFWPAVQQSVNEFASYSSSIEPPAAYCDEHFSKIVKVMRGAVCLVRQGEAQPLPLLLKGRQWILRKADLGVPTVRRGEMSQTDPLGHRGRIPSNTSSIVQPRPAFKCCLNGWVDHQWACNATKTAPCYTRCNHAAGLLQQNTCRMGMGAKAPRECRWPYACWFY
jgi:hypothetical protein